MGKASLAGQTNVFLKNEKLIRECYQFLKDRPVFQHTWTKEETASNFRGYLRKFNKISEVALAAGSDGNHYEMYRACRTLARTLQNSPLIKKESK